MFHVRYLVRQKTARADRLSVRLRAAIPSLVFHLAALTGAFLLSHAGLLPTWTPCALAPAVVRVGVGVLVRRRGPVLVRRLGLVELAHTVAFVSLVLVTMNVPTPPGS